MSIGRNDPCPCGSGRKYKKCHGMMALSSGVATPEAARATTLKALDVKVAERLLQFARSRFGHGWMAEAVHTYLHDQGGAQDELDAEVDVEVAVPGALHFLAVTADGRTLADLWRDEQGKRLTPDTRLLLDAYRASWLSIWEVSDVQPGAGSTLTDMLTREQRFARDVSSSRTLGRFDTLLAIVLDCGGVSFFGGAHHQPLPPREGEAVLQDAKRICRVRTRPVPPAKLRDPAIQRELIARWRREVHRMLTRPAPVMQNTDGDPLSLTTDDFELTGTRDDVVRRLGSIPGAVEPEPEGNDIVVVITKPGNAQHRSWDNTVIGRIIVMPRGLRIETNSTRRADSLRSAVETHVRGMVRFRLRQETNTSALIESARSSSQGHAASTRDRTPPELVAAVRQFREQHMKAWLDDSIPALDGLTPRHAATLPRMRPRLEVLLKEFERSEARLPPEERIDLRELQAALGL